MNPKIEKFLTVFWHTALFCVIGAIFNSGIAFASVWFEGVQIITAALTGYGIYQLFKGKT